MDADAYGIYHVLSNLFADERAFAVDLLDIAAKSEEEQDKLLACFVIGVGNFLFVRPTKTLTEGNIYTLCHPPQAARMDFIMRRAVSWCRNNREALATWMTPEVFSQIMATMAYATAWRRRGPRVGCSNNFPERRRRRRLHEDVSGESGQIHSVALSQACIGDDWHWSAGRLCDVDGFPA